MSYQKVGAVTTLRPWVSRALSFLLGIAIGCIILYLARLPVKWELQKVKTELAVQTAIVKAKDSEISRLEQSLVDIKAELRATKGITSDLLDKVEKIESNRKVLSVPSGSVLRVEQQK